jgi:signal transduction histidine kinase
VVIVIGIALSLAVAGYLQAEVANESRDRLATHGELFSQVIQRDLKLVVEQVRGFRGFFEASVHVTDQEFELFSKIVGFDRSSILLYATRQELSDGTLMWRVKNVVASRAIGPGVGADLSKDPVQAEAIAYSIVTGQPTVSGFTVVDADDHRGDVGVFQPVTADGRVVGVVGAMVLLDERLETAAANVLDAGETWDFVETTTHSDHVSTPDKWSRSLDFGLKHFQVSVVSDGALHPWEQRPLMALVAGVLITGLAARLMVDSKRRDRTDREIEWLRRSAGDKDRFLAGVGHELRTPLTVVVGMLDLAADPGRKFNDDDRAELMTTARVHAQEISRIVDDFLTAGRLAADALTVRSQPTDLDSLVARIIASAHPDPRLVVTAANDLGTCLGDGLRISQILLNLLNNAIRNAHGLVEIVGHVDDRFVTVQVCNDGPAVRTEQSHNLFEPFTAVRPEGQPQPVGLGLSVSRALARRMGGDLVYEWRDERVVFSLLLPVVPTALVAATA